MSSTPEVDELIKLTQNQATLTEIAKVIDWLRNASGADYRFCRFDTYDDEWVPDYDVSSEKLAARYLNIDLGKAQRQEMAWRDWNLGLDGESA